MKRTPLRRGKPLARGKCELYRSPLKRGGRLKTRDFRKRKEGRYGPLWEKVRRMPCFVAEKFGELHTCGLGYAPASAHHVIPGGQDQEGLAPCSGAVHNVLEAQKRRVTVDLSSVCDGNPIHVNIRKLGLEYVDRARDEENSGC